MRPTARSLGILTATAALGLSLSACGGAPDDASAEDFCEAYSESFNVFADIDPEASEDEQAEQLAGAYSDWADGLKEVGTPEDISDEEREGFEIFVGALEDIDEDKLKDAIASGEDSDFEEAAGVDADDSDKVEAFNGYATEKCADTGGE